MPQEKEIPKEILDRLNHGGYVPPEMPKTDEKTVQPGFFSRLGGTLLGQVESLGIANPESLAMTLQGMDESRQAVEKSGGSRLRSELAGSPVAPISEDIYNKNWSGLSGTGAGMLLGGLLTGTPEGRGAFTGAMKEGFGTEPYLPWLRKGGIPLPRGPARAALAYGAGEGSHYGLQRLGIPTSPELGTLLGLGYGIWPFLKGGYEGAMEAYRARPWSGPKGVGGETRTPYVPPRSGASEYRNPPSGSVVSGTPYEVPTDEPSPLDKLSSGYREQLKSQGPPRPDLPPSTSGSINLQKMIQSAKDMLKRRSQD